MDELKFQTIQPVGGQRGPERGQAKDPATGRKWEQALLDAGAQLERVSSTVTSTVSSPVTTPAGARGPAAMPGPAGDSKALQAEVQKSNEQFQQLMKLHQNLSQLYLQIHKLDSEKA